MGGVWVEPSSMADDYDPPSGSLNPPEPNAEITRLRRQVADLTEERAILVRQLRAIRNVVDPPGSHLAQPSVGEQARRFEAIRDILDGVVP